MTARIITLGVFGALLNSSAAAPQRRSYVAVSVKNFNDYKVGEKPDISDLFDAPFDGCFGMFRDNQNCVSEKPNDSFVRTNPEEGAKDRVMEINMRGGKYGTHASHTGGQFYASHLENYEGLTDATFEYSVYFPDGFDWAKGGKLPGLFGGSKKCSGGQMPQDAECFSTRLMWREWGDGEAYLYVPMLDQDPSFCRKCAYPVQDTKCANVAHCSLNRGAFSFGEGEWTHIRQYVRLNTVGTQDGEFTLYVNNHKVMSESLSYRTTEKIGLSGFLFSVFFGGDSQQYAPSSDQKVMFKDFELRAGR